MVLNSRQTAQAAPESGADYGVRQKGIKGGLEKSRKYTSLTRQIARKVAFWNGEEWGV